MGDDGDALREERLRRELGRWRVERPIAVVWTGSVVAIGALALAGTPPGARSWWAVGLAAVALVLALRSFASAWSRRRWSSTARPRIGYHRTQDLHAAVARGDPVAPEHRGLAVETRLPGIEAMRGMTWVVSAQTPMFATQLDPALPESLDVLRLVFTGLLLVLAVGGFVLIEIEARRAARLFAQDPDQPATAE